jgi:CheY-like chemotaxis protein
MMARDGREDAGTFRFGAWLTTPASRDRAFEVDERLTPYEIETLLVNAASYPSGSRLDLLVSGDADDALLVEVRRRLRRLETRGIAVSIRRAPSLARIVGRNGMNDSTVPDFDRGKRLVLVADDDPDMRRLVATLVRMAGHRVIEASDGAQVLTRIEATAWRAACDPIDVIVSDINMPGLSGLDLLAALRCARLNTPVVLITAFGDEETRAEAGGLGASVLDKPFEPEALRAAIASARPS